MLLYFTRFICNLQGLIQNIEAFLQLSSVMINGGMINTVCQWVYRYKP